MAKKVVKKTAKKAPYTHSHHHHNETNNLVLIVAGGFVVLVVLMFMVANTNMMLNRPTVSQAAQNQEVKSANIVSIASYAYAPETITVKVGDTVTFTNNDSMAHTVTADDGSFDTGNIAQGESKTVTFDKAGTFTYHCTYHPYMKGTVVVEE